MLNHFRRLFPLLLLIFLDSFSYFVVIPVLLQLYFNNHYGLLPADTSLHMRNFLTGFTICLSTFAALVAAPFIGSASDKYGRKKTLLICTVGTAIGFLLPIFGIKWHSLTLVLLGRLIAGVGSASQPIGQAAVADLCEGQERAQFFSWIAFSMTLPLILGPFVGGYLSNDSLVSWFTITTPYWCAFILSVLCLLLIAFGFRETMSQGMRAQMLSVRDVIVGLPKAIKGYQIGILLLIFFCLEVGWSQYYQSIFLYLSETFHYSTQHVSLFITYMGVLMCFGLLVLYPLIIRYLSAVKFLRLSLWLVFIGLLGCTIFKTPLAQWIFAPLIAIFVGTAYVNVVTLISYRVPASHQGWAMGYTSTVLFIAWLITAFDGGILISFHALVPLIIASIALLISAFLSLKKFDGLPSKNF